MAGAVGALDEAIKEYLLYRGFTQTLKYFEIDRRDDKDKGFRVNRIVEYLMQCVVKSDFQALQSFWVYLYKRFFSQMNSESLTIAYRLETNMLRLFLVQASRSGRHDEVRGFFEKMSDSLHDRKEWKDWFALPFTKTPEQHPTFKLYYSKEWLDAFQITLHNFFSTLFTSLHIPSSSSPVH